MSFDGIDDYVIIPEFGLTGNFSVEMWIWVEEVPKSTAVIITNSTGFAIGFSSSGGLLTTPAPISKNRAMLSNFVGGQWNHLAISYDVSGTPRVYINGSDDAYGTPNSFVSPGSYIGRRISGDYIKGKMDEVRIWNYARTEEEIARDMNVRLNGDEAGLVGYWRFDEGAGNTAKDCTANANHGTINGATWATSEVQLG